MKKSKTVYFGPAVLVTAAFIGPGTVLIASQAGAKYGFSLLWAVVFATASGIVLQEMAGRLGIATGSGLAQAIGRTIGRPVTRWLVLGLVLLGIFIGNSAFQTGNLIGSAAGLDIARDFFSSSNPAQSPASEPEATMTGSATSSLAPAAPRDRWSLWGIAAIAWLLILLGRFDWLQRILTVLVVFMSAAFLIAAGLCNPSLAKIAAGLVPQIPPESGWLIVGLIGTTIVPYNLFLHASAAADRWPPASVKKTSDKIRAVADSAKNTRFAVGIGGLITAAILITAAVAFEPTPVLPLPTNDPMAVAGPSAGPAISQVGDIAKQLEPALGNWAGLLFGLGLCGAGLTSAITAPVAAAYAVAGSFGWPSQLSDWRLKLVASIVLLIGLSFAILFGASPQVAILTAQAVNGLLLPILAILLLIMLNQVKLVTRFHNSKLQNGIAITMIAIVTLIAARQIVIVYVKVKEHFSSTVNFSTWEFLSQSLATGV